MSKLTESLVEGEMFKPQHSLVDILAAVLKPLYILATAPDSLSLLKLLRRNYFLMWSQIKLHLSYLCVKSKSLKLWGHKVVKSHKFEFSLYLYPPPITCCKTSFQIAWFDMERNLLQNIIITSFSWYTFW